MKGKTVIPKCGQAGSLKDAIESLGIPHTEVQYVVADDAIVPLNTRIAHDTFYQVWPWEIEKDAPRRFVLDVHLGKLCRLMRLMGIDTYYRNDLTDREIVQEAVNGKRVVLTRDIGLLKYGSLEWGHWLRSQLAEEQLAAATKRFNLCPVFKPFSRCILCNTSIVPASKEELAGKLEAKTALYFHEFNYCPGCRQVYWKGSHFKKMEVFVHRFLAGWC